MRTLPALPQLYDRTQAMLRDAGVEVAKLTMGPFDCPLTREQRAAMDDFVAAARDREVPMVYLHDAVMEVAHVLVINTKAPACHA